MKAGATVAGGSDAPVEACSPFLGMYDAMHRSSREDAQEVFQPSECLSFAEALYMYTVAEAKVACVEHKLGSIQQGYVADLVLVDAAILSDYERLRSAHPRKVFIGGKVVFDLRDCEPGGEQCVVQGPFVPGRNGARRKNPFKCSCCRSKSMS